MAKQTTKVIGIVENDAVTGVRYGEIEVPVETKDIAHQANHIAVAKAYTKQAKHLKEMRMHRSRGKLK